MKNKKAIQKHLDGLVTAANALPYLLTKEGEPQTSTTAIKRLVDKGEIDFVIQGRHTAKPTRLFFVKQLEKINGIVL